MSELRTKTFVGGDIDKSLSRYRLIEAVLREEIVSGEYGAGDQLPTEAELCEMFGASRPTVRQALGALEADDLIVREHGRGSFVKPLRRGPLPKRFELSFDELVEPPEPIKITIQRNGLIKGHGFVHTMMNLPEGAELFYFVRIYSLGRTAIAAAKIHVPSAIGARLCKADFSARNVPEMIAALSQQRLASCAFSFDSTLAEPRYAEMLDARAGSPLTSIRRTSYGSGEAAIEHTHLLLRPDMCHLVGRRTFG